MLGSGGDSQLPPWFAWLSQDWSAGNDDDCGHTGNDSVADYGNDPFLNRLSMVENAFLGECCWQFWPPRPYLGAHLDKGEEQFTNNLTKSLSILSLNILRRMVPF